MVTEDVFSGLIRPALFNDVHEKRMYHNINKTRCSANDDHRAAANLVRSNLRVYRPPSIPVYSQIPPVDDRQLPNMPNTGAWYQLVD